jgi:hypothetical protein
MPVVGWNLLQRITADSLRVYETIHRAQKMNEESESVNIRPIRVHPCPIPRIQFWRRPNERPGIPPTDRRPAPLL